MIVVWVLLLLPSSERDWVAVLAKQIDGAKVEAVLWDRSRVDVLTSTMAMEFDWARKWKEGVGQAAFYAAMTDRQGVVVLLLKDGLNTRNKVRLFRARVAAKHADVWLWAYDCKTFQWILRKDEHVGRR